jgi:hypothetical protein
VIANVDVSQNAGFIGSMRVDDGRKWPVLRIHNRDHKISQGPGLYLGISSKLTRILKPEMNSGARYETQRGSVVPRHRETIVRNLYELVRKCVHAVSLALRSELGWPRRSRTQTRCTKGRRDAFRDGGSLTYQTSAERCAPPARMSRLASATCSLSAPEDLAGARPVAVVDVSAATCLRPGRSHCGFVAGSRLSSSSR